MAPAVTRTDVGRPGRVHDLSQAGGRTRHRGVAPVSRGPLAAEPVFPLSGRASSQRCAGPDADHRRRDRAATSLVAESGGRIVAFAGFHSDPRCGRSRRGGVRRLRCRAGARHRHAPARAPASIARDQASNVRRVRAGRQPPDARRVSRLRLRGDAPTVERGRLPRGLVARRSRPVLRTRRPQVPSRRDGVDESLLRAAGRRGRRRQSRTRQDRIGDPAQPRGCGFHGHDRARASDRAGRSKGSPPTGASSTSPDLSISP